MENRQRLLPHSFKYLGCIISGITPISSIYYFKERHICGHGTIIVKISVFYSDYTRAIVHHICPGKDRR